MNNQNQMRAVFLPWGRIRCLFPWSAGSAGSRQCTWEGTGRPPSCWDGRCSRRPESVGSSAAAQPEGAPPRWGCPRCRCSRRYCRRCWTGPGNKNCSRPRQHGEPFTKQIIRFFKVEFIMWLSSSVSAPPLFCWTFSIKKNSTAVYQITKPSSYLLSWPVSTCLTPSI